MGQTHSTPQSGACADGAHVNPRLANFRHICNITPDTPENGCLVWDYERVASRVDRAYATPTACASVPEPHDTRSHGHEQSRRRSDRRAGTKRGGRNAARSRHPRSSAAGAGVGTYRHQPAFTSDEDTSDVATRTHRTASGGTYGRARRRRRGANRTSVADYTTDDESDAVQSESVSSRYDRRAYHDRAAGAGEEWVSGGDTDATGGMYDLQELNTAQPGGSPAHTDSRADSRVGMDTARTLHQPLPHTLDRRYDLDVAPSMLNMNLKFNGAYMVAAGIYNILMTKFEYKYMLSVQMLFWTAVQQYYQIPLLDKNANYKISLSSLLSVAQNIPLCSERELSIYTNVAELHHRHTRLYEDHLARAEGGSAAHRGHRSSGSSECVDTNGQGFTPSTFGTHHLRPRNSPSAKLTRPFYRMQPFYVPKEASVIKRALQRDHLVLANLTLFSSFLSSRQGVVRPPNETDTPAGMVVITLVGYQDGVWIARFPFGVHWGDQGVGYISTEYFDRYNRDRWIIDIDECSEPPEYRQQREMLQASGNAAEAGLLAVHMETSPTQAHAFASPTAQVAAGQGGQQQHQQRGAAGGGRRRVCA